MSTILSALILLTLLPPATQPAAEELRRLLPKEVAALKQASTASQSNDGHNIATAAYTLDQSPVSIILICIRYPDAETAAAVSTWFTANVNESDAGKTRRTATIAGYRSLEEHESDAQSGGISIRLNDRTILLMLYNGIEAADAITAAERLPLQALSAAE